MRAAISLLVMGLLFASYTQTISDRLFSSRGSGRILPNQSEVLTSNNKDAAKDRKHHRGEGRRRAYSPNTNTIV
ncbi:MAG: hypothetical protein QNJ47_11900 [Nostocaceae cyanobacterium]|nr:hypothetical protein [Nostocaceae cyanobacterium]